MKTIRVALLAPLALLLVTGGLAHAGEQTIAHVDAESIIPAMPEYKRAKSEVEAYGKQLQRALESKQQAMQEYYQDVMERVQSGAMPPVEQKEAETKLQQMQQDLQKRAVEADEELARKEAELTRPVYDRFNAAVKKVARDRGYAYIVDKKLFLYTDGGIDATPLVRAELGLP